MAMVEVHNLNEYDYKEKFKGEDVLIKAKSFIEMDFDMAHQFKSTMNNVEFDADGNVKPEFYKMIKVVQSNAEKKAMQDIRAKETSFKCQACGYMAKSKQDLHIHTKEEHLHDLEDPKVAKQLLKEK